MRPQIRDESRTALLSIFLFTIGGGIAMLTVPLYANSLGATYFDVGLMSSLSGIVYALSALPLGMLSDLYGRKKILVSVEAFAGLCYLLYGTYSRDIPTLTLIKAAEGLAWGGWWAVVEAYMTERFERAGKHMGTLATIYGIDFMVGSVISGYLARISFTLSFLLSSVSAFSSAAVFALTIKGDARGGRGYRLDDVRRSIRPGSEKLELTVPYLIAITYSYVLGICFSVYPIYLNEVLGDEFLAGVVVGLFWLGRIFSFVFLAPLSDRVGREPILKLAMGSVTLSLIWISIRSPLFIIPGSILLGVGLGAAFPVAVAMISDFTAIEIRGLATGLFESIIAIGSIIGPYTAGVLSDRVGSNVPYAVSSLITVSALLILLVKRKILRGGYIPR